MRERKQKLVALGNTLKTAVLKSGGTVLMITTRSSGESDDDFIDRHARAVWAALQASSLSSPADSLTLEEPAFDPLLSLVRGGRDDSQFASAWAAAIKAA